MKIFFVSQAIKPMRGGASHVTEELASNFTKEEMMVFGEKSFWNSKLERDDSMPNFYYANTNLSFRGRGRRFFLLFIWMLLPYLLWKMNRAFKREKCDYVFATFPNNYYLCAAYLISKWNNVGFSSYFHNTYLENRPDGFNGWFARILQPKIFAHSDHIFVMSEGMKASYEKRYPEIKDKFVPLLHTFNEYPPENKKKFDPNKEVFDLVMIGNFNYSNLEATGRLVRALKPLKQFKIKVFTPVEKTLLKMRGIDVDAIDYRGFISDEQFYPELQGNDICVLTHGFTGGYSEEEYATIFPTRTIPLLLSGNPIFAHSPPNSFLTKILKEYDAAEVVEVDSEEEVANRLAALVKNPERIQQLRDNAKVFVKNYYGPLVAQFLKEKIAEVMPK